MQRIYLDNNATTGVDPRVLEAMLQELSMVPANPSSTHFFGREARHRLLRAREQIAHFLKVKPQEVIFTSGGTESLNLILRGAFEHFPKGAVISSNVEHASVFHTLEAFKKKGWQIHYLPVGPFGALNIEQLEKALDANTRFIVLGAVNSETGVKIDLEKIAKLALFAGIPLVIDGVALLGKELFDIPEGVSAMAFSGHKIHAPKGIGFAVIRSSFRFPSVFTGGEQEYSKRAGTENLSGIIGLAKAIELLSLELPSATAKMQALRDRLEQGLKEKFPSLLINGDGPRICNTSNLSFPGVDGENLLMSLDLAGIAASHGSACSSGALEPSRVLINMGVSTQLARSAIRFSLSRWTTDEEIKTCIETTSTLIEKLAK
jgi:cysteine desulfurase